MTPKFAGLFIALALMPQTPALAAKAAHPPAAAQGLTPKQIAAIDRYVTAEIGRQRIDMGRSNVHGKRS